MNVYRVLADCEANGEQFITRLDVRAASDEDAKELAIAYCRQAMLPVRAIEEVELAVGDAGSGRAGVLRTYGRGYYDYDDEAP